MSDYSYLGTIEKEHGNLIKGLQLIQSHEGYISNESIKAAAGHFGIAEVEVEGVLTFYTQFKRIKPGKHKISLCDGTACHIKGSSQILEWVNSTLGIKSGETDANGVFSLETVACLGCCSLAPVMSINGKIFGNLDRKSTMKILKEYQNQ